MTDTSSNSVFDLARRLYADAWGKEWPYRSSGTVSMEDTLPGESKLLRPNEFGDDDDRVNPADDLYDEDGAFPTDWAYTCLHKMNSVATACGGAGILAVQDVLVVRKAVFLLYLLLSRLKRKLATVVQLSSHMIVAFNHRGAFVEPADTFLNLSGRWALMDSNSDCVDPAPALLWSRPRIIQAAPPETARWKRWAQDSSAEIVISALPTPLEIGAVGFFRIHRPGLMVDQKGVRARSQPGGPSYRQVGPMHSHDPRAHRRWPRVPCIPREQALFAKVESAAVTACRHTDAYCHMGQLEKAYIIGTTLLFIHPRRPRHPTYVPGACLIEIFHKEFLKLVNGNPFNPLLQIPFSVIRGM